MESKSRLHNTPARPYVSGLRLVMAPQKDFFAFFKIFNLRFQKTIRFELAGRCRDGTVEHFKIHGDAGRAVR